MGLRDALGTVPKNLEERLEELEIETTQTTANTPKIYKNEIVTKKHGLLWNISGKTVITVAYFIKMF